MPITKTINTLVEDIYGLFVDGRFAASREAVQAFADKLAQRISVRIGEERGKPTLRLSNLGSPCERKLWYSINSPQVAEKLPPSACIKFLFGDILEEMLFWLASLAGHDVTGEQDEVVVEGVTGHRDGVIDGTLVDAKSASSYSFQKFENHLVQDHDAFGYLTQLDTYLEGSDDPLVRNKDEAAFLVIDKQLGKICLDKHPRKGVDYKKMVAEKRAMLGSNLPPARPYFPEPDGKSGNLKLGIACSYCSFKKECYPSLRTFIYANGPRFLTRVERVPDVPEIK